MVRQSTHLLVAAFLVSTAVVLVQVGCSRDKAQKNEASPAAPAAKVADPAATPPSTGADWQRRDLATVKDDLGGEVFAGTLELPVDAKLEGFRLTSGELIPTGTVRVGAISIDLDTRDKPWTAAQFKSVNKVKPDDIVKEQPMPGGFAIIYRHGGELIISASTNLFGCTTTVKEQDQADIAFRICTSYQAPSPGGAARAASGGQGPVQPGGFATADLAGLPDDEARAVTKSFVEAVMGNDAAALEKLLASKIKVGKQTLTSAEAAQQIGKRGAKAFVGMEPNCWDDAGGHHCEWNVWQLEVKGNSFSVFHGSGNGRNRVARFDRADGGAWKLVALVDEEGGSP